MSFEQLSIWQTPPEQLTEPTKGSAAQSKSQVPQWATVVSVSIQFPPHEVVPPGQAHSLPSQVSSPLQESLQSAGKI